MASIKGKLPPSTVQSIILNGNEVPEKYIQKNINCLPAASLPWMEDLIIDFSLLSSRDSSLAVDKELQKLYSALSSWGCFQIVNHGMTNSFLDKIRQAMRQFYAFPLEEKQKYSRGVDGYDGYGNDSIINAGDLIEIMSNVIFKSAVHRVVTNSERERLSLVMFCFPSNDTEIEPFKELISCDRPQSYKKVDNYMDLFFQHYQKGQFTLDVVRI